MDLKENVIDEIGYHNLNILLEETNNGNITHDTMHMIAVQMGGSVRGVFAEKSQQKDIKLVDVLREFPRLEAGLTWDIFSAINILLCPPPSVLGYPSPS
jgi:hypothetical protein